MEEIGAFRVKAAIVAYNRPKSLIALIDSLLKQTYPVSGIIVMDNSTDTAVQQALGRYAAKILYEKTEENIGSAGGFHRAIGAARNGSDFIWIFDDDMNIDDDALEQLMRQYHMLINGDPSVGVVRCWFDGCGEHAPQAMSTFAWRGTCIKTSVVEAVGLPDASLFLYGEDVEYAIRIKRSGFSMYYIPTSVMRINAEPTKSSVSVGGKTVTFHNSPFRLYYALRNELLVAVKYRDYSRLIKTALHAIKLFWAVLLLKKENKRAFLRPIIIGVFHGLTGKKGRYHNAG